MLNAFGHSATHLADPADDLKLSVEHAEIDGHPFSLDFTYSADGRWVGACADSPRTRRAGQTSSY